MWFCRYRSSCWTSRTYFELFSSIYKFYIFLFMNIHIEYTQLNLTNALQVKCLCKVLMHCNSWNGLAALKLGEYEKSFSFFAKLWEFSTHIKNIFSKDRKGFHSIFVQWWLAGGEFIIDRVYSDTVRTYFYLVSFPWV